MFTEVFSKDDWLKLVDNMFLNRDDPELLIYFLISYLLLSKPQLLQVACVEELHEWLTQTTNI